MRVVHLTPGTGGTFYCQNCMRDATLMRALRRRGTDVVLVPMYLPMSVDAEGLEGHAPVFFGGINVYLQQEYGLFRHTPRWLDRFFDSGWMLKQAAMREGATSAEDLGPMTWSMLQGRDGNQRKELYRLVTWMQGQERPDVIHVSNALLLGVAVELKNALNVPIVCTLQDEHTWLDLIPEPHGPRCWEAIKDMARQVDKFIAVSDWYAGEMSGRLGLPRERIAVAPVGIEVEGAEPAPEPPDPPVIGYLSRMADCLGFGLLVEAFIALKKDPRLAGLRLRATGGKMAEDDAFLEQVHARLREEGVETGVEFLETFDKSSRLEFMRSLSVLSVPAPQGEAFGLFIVEALASGVPVVQPEVAGFREVVTATGGGVLYPPERKDALAGALRGLLLDPERARALGLAGRAKVLEKYDAGRVAEQVQGIYESAVQT